MKRLQSRTHDRIVNLNRKGKTDFTKRKDKAKSYEKL